MANATISNRSKETPQAPQVPPVQRPVNGSRLDSIMYIQTRTRQLDEVIASLLEERGSLQCELNCLQSPIMSLFNENLSTIFEYASPKRDLRKRQEYFSVGMSCSKSDHPQLALAAVCSRWRQVARSNPNLWTSIILEITSRNAEKQAAFLQYYLNSTSAAPLSLALRYKTDFGLETKALVHPTIDELLIQNLPRVQELFLVLPPRNWHSHLSSLTQLEICFLDLDTPRDRNERVEITLSRHAPLRYFFLNDTRERRHTILAAPWSMVTSVNLFSVDAVTAITILLQCPNIVEFRTDNYRSQPQQNNNPLALVTPVTFKDLEIFELCIPDCGLSRAVARNLNLPALKELKWYPSFTNQLGGGPPDFFCHIPSTVVTLDMKYSDIGYIRDDSKIERLRVFCCNFDEIKALFQRLRPRPCSDNQGLVKSFPNMKELLLKGMPDLSTPVPAEFAWAFLKTMEKRAESGDISFRFQSKYVRIDWTPEVRTRLKALVAGGFDLKIIDWPLCGEVDWL